MKAWFLVTALVAASIALFRLVHLADVPQQGCETMSPKHLLAATGILSLSLIVCTAIYCQFNRYTVIATPGVWAYVLDKRTGTASALTLQTGSTTFVQLKIETEAETKKKTSCEIEEALREIERERKAKENPFDAIGKEK
jgi:hypothetical protein